MRKALLAVCTLISGLAFAGEPTIDFNFQDAEIAKVVKDYAKASGQKFIVDPSVHGHITIINSGPVTVAEAFNQLSSALALNSIGVSRQDDVMVLMQARALQRNFIDVSQELPAMKPERMFTWVVNLKYTSADDVNKQLRILTSKDGELVPYIHNNQLLISDWVSNLYRISKILKELDIPASKTGTIEAKAKSSADKKLGAH